MRTTKLVSKINKRLVMARCMWVFVEIFRPTSCPIALDVSSTYQFVLCIFISLSSDIKSLVYLLVFVLVSFSALSVFII